MKDEITFVNFRKEHGLELIQLWRKSFAQAMGIEEDTREEEVNEQLADITYEWKRVIKKGKDLVEIK